MKTLLLLGCAVWLCACSSSNTSTPLAGYQAQPTSSSAIQTPQQTADSVPPANTQQAPTNSQLPTLGSAPPAITCAQVAAALQAGGCRISNSEMSDCIAETAPGAPCGAEVQAVFACLLHGVTCNNDNGTVNMNDVCSDQSDALDACLRGNVPPPTPCTAPACDNCSSDCVTCLCQSIANPARDCTQACPVN